MGDSNSQPLCYKPSALPIELNSSKASAWKELSLSSGVLYHCIFFISHLWLTSHLRSTLFLLVLQFCFVHKQSTV